MPLRNLAPNFHRPEILLVVSIVALTIVLAFPTETPQVLYGATEALVILFTVALWVALVCCALKGEHGTTLKVYVRSKGLRRNMGMERRVVTWDE